MDDVGQERLDGIFARIHEMHARSRDLHARSHDHHHPSWKQRALVTNRSLMQLADLSREFDELHRVHRFDEALANRFKIQLEETRTILHLMLRVAISQLEDPAS